MKLTSANPEMEVVLPSTPDELYVDRLEPRGQNPGLAQLRLLWQNRRILFHVAAWGLLAATVIAFLIPAQYQSTTRLMPPENQSGSSMALFASLSSKLGGGLGSMAGDLLGMQSSGALFVGILNSRKVRDQLVDKAGLEKVYGTRSQERALRLLSDNTAIEEDRKSGIITLTVTDRSPLRAAELAQRYVLELNAVVTQLSSSSAGRERVFLEQRLSQVKQELETAEKDFSEFASATGAIDIKEQGRAMLTAAATLQGELIAAQSELEGLKQIYADNNVRVRSLRARVAELRAQLEKVGGKGDIARDATHPSDESSYPSIRKLPLLGVSYADLFRRTKIEEAVFETLTQEYELAKVAEAKEIPSVRVLDPANVPERKSFPPRLVIMFLGTFLALTCAAVCVLARARWQKIDSQEPHKVFARELFHAVNATMPWATPNGSRLQSTAHSAWVRLVRRNRAARNDPSRGKL